MEKAHLEKAHVKRSKEFGDRQFWGVVCRNTANLGGTCCMEQVPSASKDAAIKRWNMRNGVRSNAEVNGLPLTKGKILMTKKIDGELLTTNNPADGKSDLTDVLGGT